MLLQNMRSAVKRDLAVYLIRHLDAMDLNLGAMIQALSDDDDDWGDMIAALYRLGSQAHEGVSAPIARTYPDLDRIARYEAIPPQA